MLIMSDRNNNRSSVLKGHALAPFVLTRVVVFVRLQHVFVRLQQESLAQSVSALQRVIGLGFFMEQASRRLATVMERARQREQQQMQAQAQAAERGGGNRRQETGSGSGAGAGAGGAG